MRTLKQIKDDIIAVQKELVVFEGKRAMLRKAHLGLLSYCWSDGMEIDHDAVSTSGPDLDGIEDDSKASIIAKELYSRTINAMKKLHKLISRDYGEMFAEKEDEIVFLLQNKDDLEEKNRDMLGAFRKIRKLFPPAGGECVLWIGFCASDVEALQSLLAKADDAIVRDNGQELRNVLTEMFCKQAPLLKSQVEEHLRSLKNERDQLALKLPVLKLRKV
ncbi:hypothetical protein [Fibrobacter sp.]|uniref:hypothetical protein n=1 Tax=Fibrobacter sp. TaxID=35828 RepID=UPI00388ECF30